MNETEIPTPRTDAKWHAGHFVSETMAADFASQLERENIALQSQLDDLTARSIHTCGDHCQRPNCVRRRENEKMREAIREASKVLMDILKNYECGGLIDSQCETTLAKLAPFLQ